MTIFNPTKFVTRSLIGAVGLTAIALLGAPEVAKASGADCGLNEGVIQGADWVSNCPEGSDHFGNTWASVHFNVLPNNPFDIAPGMYWEIFGGPAWITRAEGANGVIETIIEEELTSIPELGNLGIPLTLIGNGTGAIVDDTSFNGFTDEFPEEGQASSFFEVFTEIEVNGTNLSTLDPVTVFGDRALIGVSPDVIVPPGPGEDGYNPSMLDLECDPVGEVAINYCGLVGADPVELFIDGDPSQSAGIFIVAETHTVHPHVPEPSTTLGLLFLGLGSVAGLKRKDKAKK